MRCSHVLGKSLAATLIALSLAASQANTAHAGPWTRSLGEAYLQTGERLFIAQSFVDASGQLISDVDYLGASSYLYFEVGVAERLAVQGYLPFTVAINTFADGWQYMRGGWGDALLAVQWSPWESTTLAIRGDVKLPMYDLDSYDGLYAESFPAMGSGNVDSTLWLSYGGSLADSRLYLFGELGYRLRTGAYIGGRPAQAPSYSDGVAFSGQVGGTLSPHLGLALTVSALVPFEDDGISEGFVTIGQNVLVPIASGWSAVASVEQTIWAQSTSFGTGIGLGIAWAL